MLEKTAQALKPELARLKQRILQAKSVHLDETGWKTLGKKNYNWVMASGDTEEVVFLFGKNRGKGNAEKLLDGYTGVRVTDCYGAYKNLDGEQASCWSHITRKSRDIKDNANLREEKREFANSIHNDISELFGKVAKVHKTKFNKTRRMKALPALENELDRIVKKVLENPEQGVKKLTNLAKLMRDYKKQLFTCITNEGVDMTNNKAERKLRHIVLKRKNCFGTKSEKGNRVMEINMSVLLSLWWNNRDRFFPNFLELMGG
jgi:transposase-like protein